MSLKIPYEQLQKLIDPKKAGDREWFLSLLDDEKQKAYEDEHVQAVMQMLRIAHIRPRKNAVREAKEEIARIEKEEKGSAESYPKIQALLAEIKRQEEIYFLVILYSLKILNSLSLIKFTNFIF